MNLFLDVETVPNQNPVMIAEIAAGIKHPGNISKPETVAKWYSERHPEAVAEAIHKTALDCWHGEIVCVAFATHDSPAEVVSRADLTPDSERELLIEFWERISGQRVTKFIGHNVADFDLRYLYARSVVHGVRPSQAPFPPDLSPWRGFVEDTMHLASGFRGSISLDRLCKALGIESPKDGIEGSQVWAAIQEGRFEEVAEYCKRDVEATREVWKRLRFQT